jgi:hypothetical protein
VTSLKSLINRVRDWYGAEVHIIAHFDTLLHFGLR